MQVGDMMHTEVKTGDAEATFPAVGKTLRTHGISSVVVLEGKKLAGILTERDIVNLIATGGAPHTVTAAQGMTRRDIQTVSPKTDIGEAAEQMVARNIRHLPVTEGDQVVGIVSIRDLTKWAAEELAGGGAGGGPRTKHQ